jgi:hypothetical protein
MVRGSIGFFGITAARGGIDPPGALPGPDADRFVQRAAQVVQSGAVLGGVPAGQDPLGDQGPVHLAAGLAREIVMHAVTVGQQRQAAGERVETVTERVGGPAPVPAQAAGAGPGQDHPGRPAAAQDPRQAVGPSHGHQVHHAAALDQDQVLAEQVRGDIGDAWLGEQAQHAQVRIRASSELVLVEVGGRLGVADRGGHVTHPGWPGTGGPGPGRAQAEGVLHQRERVLLTGSRIQDAGKREDLPEGGGHRPSLGGARCLGWRHASR